MSIKKKIISISLIFTMILNSVTISYSNFHNVNGTVQVTALEQSALVPEHIAITQAVTEVVGRPNVTTPFGMTLPLQSRTISTEVLSEVVLSATALNQFGNPHPAVNNQIQWRFASGSNLTGVTLTDNRVTVSNNATTGSVIVEAALVIAGNVTVIDTITINIIAAVREPISVSIIPVYPATTVINEVDIASPNTNSPNRFLARALDRFGDTVQNPNVTWTVTNPITGVGIAPVPTNSAEAIVTVANDDDLEGHAFNVVLH